jgi:hypothetical protein
VAAHPERLSTDEQAAVDALRERRAPLRVVSRSVISG